MSRFWELFEKIKASDNYERNARLLQVLINSLKRGKTRATEEDLTAIYDFVIGEAKKLVDLIPKAADYRSKDAIFGYEDELLEVFAFSIAHKNVSDINRDDLDVIKSLADLVKKERALENAIDGAFKLDKLEKGDVENFLGIAARLTDEYQKSMLYQALSYYKTGFDKLSGEAKDAIAEYIGADIERLLVYKDALTDDRRIALEFACDVCRHVINEKIIALLKQVLRLKYNNVRYYAIDSLLLAKQQIDAGVIAEMAADLIYADMTYDLLREHGAADLFPAELADPEYLAKSDMVHWLDYPTELGKAPDEIEPLGTVKSKGGVYRVFKYKSGSDNLSDDLKNRWLIGWSSNNGNTFSNFDKLSDYERKTPRKTLKHIKKKLL
ncbi:MAG: hypothetical protein LBP26_03110 [Clostridiales bacterium]|jgi:hypothetical protein|nr:hypothetical protein [Clostridiales bacterium]